MKQKKRLLKSGKDKIYQACAKKNGQPFLKKGKCVRQKSNSPFSEMGCLFF